MTEKNKLKVGVVGVGALGRHHTRLYTNSKNADLVGIYDANPETAQKISEEFDVPVFSTIESLAEACEGISIAVPATLHHEVTIPLLKMKKHLLIEKPIATTVKDAEEMVKTAEENNVVLGVGHVERFNPAMGSLEKRAGTTRFIEAHRLAMYPPPRPGLHRRGIEVGVVLDLMIHDLDIVLHLVDSEVEQIDSVGVPVLSPDEDIASARIKFKNGCVANVTASRVSPDPMRRFRVFQEDAYISMDYAKGTAVMFKKGPEGIERESIPVDSHNALEKELEDFISCALEAVNTGVITDTKVSGQHGLDALKLAIQISEELQAHNKKYNWIDQSKVQ
jgi:predicted dehydrogenase